MASSPPTSSKLLDRDSISPFHVKVFYREGAYPSLTDLTHHHHRNNRSPSPSLPLHLYPTTTLTDLTHLLVPLLPPHTLPTPSIGTRLCFRLAFPSPSHGHANGAADTGLNASSAPSPRYVAKDLGSIVVGEGISAASDLDEDGEHHEDDDGHDQEGNEHTNGTSSNEFDYEDEALKHPSAAANLTLRDAKLIAGDYLLVAILPPLSSGAVAPAIPPSAATAGSVNPAPGSGSGAGIFGIGAEGPGPGIPPLAPRRGGMGIHGPGRGRENGGGGYGSGFDHRDRGRDREQREFGSGFGIGYGGRGRGGGGGGFGGGRGGGGERDRGFGKGDFPSGEWRRGERVPDGPPVGPGGGDRYGSGSSWSGFGGGRGRGGGGGGGGGGGMRAWDRDRDRDRERDRY